MESKRSPRKPPLPPELARELLTPPGKFDIYTPRLSADKTTVSIYIDDELGERAMEIGLKSILGGEKGGGHEKTRLGIEQVARERLKKSPRISARALWDQLMRNCPIRVGDYTIDAVDADRKIEDQKLVEEGGPNDSAKYLKFRAFKGYVSRLKKET